MAANLAIIITAKDQASQVMKGLAGDVEGFGGKAAAAAGMAATGVAAISAAAIAGGAVAVNAYAGFEQTMSGVKAVSGATADEMKGLSDLALNLGKETSFSAGESGKALEELVKGGVSIADIMGGAARSTLNLAAAGGVELGEAAEIAANAMSMFSLSGKDMENVANQIAGAANASSLSVGDFRYSLASVGAVAATSGLSFESTAQAIAVMGSQGLKGSDAGTSLKSMLLALQPTTKAAMAAMTELGIVTQEGGNAFFDSEGKIKPMAAIADVLKGSVEGLTEQQRLMALETMFGSDAMRAAAVLANQGADGFVEMAAGMNKVTAASVAADRLDNMRGSMEQLKGSLETAGIMIGAAFAPKLRVLADAATEAVNGVIDALGNPEIMAGITSMVDTIAETLGWAIDFFKTQVWPVFQELGEIATRVFSGDIAGALDIMMETVKDVAPRLLEQLGIWAQQFIDWIGPMIPPMLQELGILIASYLDWITEQAPPLAEKFLAEWVPAAITWVAQAAVDIIPKLFDLIKAVGDWIISTGAPKFLEYGMKLGTAILKGIFDGIGNLAGKLGEYIGSVAGGIEVRSTGGGGDYNALAAGTRASGGPVWPGASFLVGERGPELFTPSVPGSISPRGGINVYVTVQGSVIRERDLAVSVREQLLQLGRSNLSVGLA